MIVAPPVVQEPPNGGVPPSSGPPAIFHHPPNADVPWANRLPAFFHNQINGTQALQVHLGRALDLATKMMANEGAPAVAHVPLLPVVPGFFGAGQTALSNGTPVHIETHFHWHTHNNGANTQNANPQVQPPTPTPNTHTWIKFISHGDRPCDNRPLPWPRNVEATSAILLKTLSIRDFLVKLGSPQQAGFGVQQVFKEEGEVWGAGQVFEWGAGQPDVKLGSTELGRGIEGREVWIVKWARGT